MTPLEHRDVLAVTIGAGGVRARRTGRSDAADSLVEVPDAPVGAGTPRDASALVAAVGGLTSRDGRPPEATVWVVPREWPQRAALDLYAAAREAAAREATIVPTGVITGGLVAVADESFAGHAGALGGVGPGSCLDVGVSASVLATDLQRTWLTLDGWGVPLGSRGSGAWIGAQGLAAALRARDGVPGGSTALLEAGRREFGPEEGWPGLFAGTSDRGDAATALTTFAPGVCDAAHDDALARDIVAAAGDHLADLLAAGQAAVPGAPIVAVGGLLYLEGVRVALAAALGRRRMLLIPGLGGALEGARLLGEHLLSGGVLPHRPPYLIRGAGGELAS